MSESVFPVTTRGPRLTYIKFGRRSSLETFAVVPGGMKFWRKSEVSDADYRSTAGALGDKREQSQTRHAKRMRRNRAGWHTRPTPQMETCDIPPMRGDFKLVTVENPNSEGPRVIVAHCTGEFCVASPGVARMELHEWIGVQSKGRMRCRICASKLKSAIHRAVSARSRGKITVQA